MTSDDVEQKELSYTTNRIVSWCSHYGNSMEIPKIKIELPHNPAIPLLDIYLKKIKMLQLKKYMHVYVHAELFTIAKIWNQN